MNEGRDVQVALRDRDPSPSLSLSQISLVARGRRQLADLARQNDALGRAEMGDADAQYELCWLIIERDGYNLEANTWVLRAALQGHAKAQYCVGLILLLLNSSLGTERPDASGEAEAVVWLEKAAEQGYAGAQHALGELLERSRGVAQDPAELTTWIRLFAIEREVEKLRNRG